MHKLLMYMLLLTLLTGCSNASNELNTNDNISQSIINDGNRNIPHLSEAENDSKLNIPQDNEIAEAEIQKTESSILIAYFSVPESSGVDAVSGASRVVVEGEAIGNTQLIAQWISEQIQGDLFEIKTIQTYPGEHDNLLDFASGELGADARPELSASIDNLGQYETIFIGYPIWWADMPAPLYTFFDAHDFSGKAIIPFTTHGGSRFANTIRTIEELEPDAEVIQNGLSISRDNVPSARSEVTSWLSELDYIS